jgi:hypothetical protein
VRTDLSGASSQNDWTSARWSHVGDDEFAAEADERINRAVRADTFALDD